MFFDITLKYRDLIDWIVSLLFFSDETLNYCHSEHIKLKKVITFLNT